MARRTTPPPQQVLAARAALKRKTAEKYELYAYQLRLDAARCEEQWRAWRAQEAARQNVEQRASA